MKLENNNINFCEQIKVSVEGGDKDNNPLEKAMFYSG